jgi:Rps23 Pro-64 3,4-dihydroxylase Tpa1-like proline 4-hydroxylase
LSKSVEPENEKEHFEHLAETNMSTNYLNPDLNRTSIRQDLKTKSFHVIQDVLKPEVADALYQSVRDQAIWEHVYRAGEKQGRDKISTLKNMSTEDLQKKQRLIIQQALKGYQFSYNRYSILDEVLDNYDPNNFMHIFMHYLNSEEFIEFAHEITQDKEIVKCEAQACWYAPGQFLKLHQDNNPINEDRRYAYVFGLTKEWQSDWGGLLQFVEDGKVTNTITPAFNTLAIFKVPQDHQVSYIAPYALKPRFTVTGWMRAS